MCTNHPDGDGEFGPRSAKLPDFHLTGCSIFQFHVMPIVSDYSVMYDSFLYSCYYSIMYHENESSGKKSMIYITVHLRTS
jgi:hypothetical protein